MSASINNEIELENAQVAISAAVRITEVMQADTRMKALAIASGRTIQTTPGGGWPLLESTQQEVGETRKS